MPKIKISKESGFAHLLVLVLALGIVSALTIAVQPTTQTFPQNSPEVMGALIAKGDEKKDERSGNNNPNPQPKIFRPEAKEIKNEVKEIKKFELEKNGPKKTELENEVENELKKPEVGELKFKSENGKFELEVKGPNGLAQKITGAQPPTPNQQNSIKLMLGQIGQTGNQEVEINTDGNTLKFKSKESEAQTRFPISLDKTTGQLTVDTGNGPKQIRVLPDQASQVAKTAGVQNQIGKIELIAGDLNSPDFQKFKITGVKSGNLFGFIPVSAPVESEVGVQTGQLTKVTEPTWLRLLSPFIK